ncbi:MAG: hypothetical protein FJ104_15955, partial [Deltaproteobacteria bacterium]|nr:hypothetical protein [Deltaproteobacteria bacterium]
DTNLSVPDTNLSVPDTNLSVPDTNLPVPDTNLPVPDTNLPVPDTDLPVPDAQRPNDESEERAPMDDRDLDKWTNAAYALPGAPSKLNLPVHVLAREAIDVARFCQRNWEPQMARDGRIERPGLKSAVGTGTFTPEITEELLELHAALQVAQTRYLLTRSAPHAPLTEKGLAALGELRETLGWYAEGGKHDEAEAQLGALTSAHEHPLSHDAVAAALYDYAELADRLRTGIAGLGDFDLRVIDDARRLAVDLRERSAGPAVRPPQQGERAALELRNRIGRLLVERMRRVRAAAKFVYRKHPASVREVTSSYWRKSRAVTRQRSQAGTPAVPPSTSPRPAAATTDE